MSARYLAFDIPGYALGAVRRADGSGSWLVEAHDVERDRRVLLKVLARADADAGDALARRTEERLRREARAAARVHHPSIVRVFDLVETPECLALVMEAVDAPDLDTLLRDAGPLPVARAVAVARDLARGLHELHRAGVVHRDVTPANVLVPGHGPAVLVDLGLARLRDAGPLTAPDVLMGTPAYMAPEQAEDPRAADARADIYALGATLFAMVTGLPPFLGEGLEPLRQALKGGAPDVRTLRPETSPALAQLVARCLSRERESRPANAAEVAGALDALASVDASDSGPAPTTTPLVVMAATPPAVASVAAPPAWRRGSAAGFTLGLAAALAVAWGTWPRGRDSAPAPATASEPGVARPPVPPPVTPAPTGDASSRPGPSRDAIASAALAWAERCARSGGTPWERAQGVLLAMGAHAWVLERYPDTFAATRLRVHREERARQTEAARARAESELAERVQALCDAGAYRDAIETVTGAAGVAEPAREAQRAAVWARAREGLQRTERLAAARAVRDGVDAGVALLEDEARRTLGPLAVEARAAIERLRHPPAGPDPIAAPAGRRLDLLTADCDELLLLGEPQSAIAVLDAAIEDPTRAGDRPALVQRRAEAVAVDAFLDGLGRALQARAGAPMTLPGGGAATLLSAGRNSITVRRGAATVSLRILDRGARFAEALLRLAWRAPDAPDALALGCLLHLDGHDAAARPWLVAARDQGAPATRLLQRVDARLAAERAERAAACLDAARLARQRERPARVLDSLDRVDREGLGPLPAASAAEAQGLATWAHARLSGLEGLVAARIGPGTRRGDVALSWVAEGGGFGGDVVGVAERLLGLGPRWRERISVELASLSGQPPGERVAIALTAANGLRAELRLLPDGRAALWLDGAEFEGWSEITLPLRLSLDGRVLVAHVAGRPGRSLDWAGTAPFQAWSSDLATGTALTVEGAVDLAWLAEARRAALQPSAPRGLRCEGPPRALRVRWQPPERGQAVGYRVFWAIGDDATLRLLSPLSAFRQSVVVRGTEARLELSGAWVAGVYVEAIGPEHTPGPTSEVRYAADLASAGASAVAVGARGEVYVAVARDPIVVRLRVDGLPERVEGVPPRGARAPAPAALVAAPGRYGTVLAVTDPEGGWCWAWGPGIEARPFGHAAAARWTALAVDGFGNWWGADAAGRRLYSFWGQRLAPIHWIGSPGGPEAWSHAGPRGLAVLADGRVAVADPSRDRVTLFRRLEGWYAVDRIVTDLPDARALAATPDGRIWVGTGASVTAVALGPEGPETGRTVHRDADGQRLERVVSLAAAPDGAVWALDAGGRLVTLPR